TSDLQVMSLTSYRAAPPRVIGGRRTEGRGQKAIRRRPGFVARFLCVGWFVLWSVVCFLISDWKTWQRPTLPRLETKYHRRRGISRPSSGWDRVQRPRYDHQVVRSENSGQRTAAREQRTDDAGQKKKLCVRSSVFGSCAHSVVRRLSSDQRGLPLC